ncbi:MAG: magnesium transporter [Candidatus Omnitrophica bacterium]|nr:magnesium transporter [Candidatus Omnitrophota bacterium]
MRVMVYNMRVKEEDIMNGKRSNKKFEVLALMLPGFRDLLVKKDFSGIRSILKDISPVDLSDGWRLLEAQEKLVIFKAMPLKKAIQLFEDLRFEDQKFILDNLNNDEITPILNDMASDERSRLFKKMSDRMTSKLFKLLKTGESDDVKKLLSFKDGSAGSIMTTDFIEVDKHITARKALLVTQERLTSAYEKDVYSVYVVDSDRRVMGKISLQELLKAPQDTPVKDIMSGVDNIKIEADIDKKEIAACFSKYDLSDAPVVDKTGKMLGIITIDDVIDMMQRQNTSEIYEIGKMNASGGEIISYQTATVWEMMRRRAGWLILLLIFDFLTGTVLKSFEASLSAVVALAFFIPMLLDTGGNAGAQTAITVIRGLATGDVNWKNIRKVARLEMTASLMMASLVGVVALGRAFLLQRDFFVAIVVGSTMFLIVIVAILSGLTLPLLSKKIGLDPAALAGPITTSIVDIIGLIIYFKIAQFFIPALRF